MKANYIARPASIFASSIDVDELLDRTFFKPEKVAKHNPLRKFIGTLKSKSEKSEVLFATIVFFVEIVVGQEWVTRCQRIFSKT